MAAPKLVKIKLKALGEADDYLRSLTKKRRVEQGDVVEMPAAKAKEYLASNRWELAPGQKASEDEGSQGT